VYVHWSWFVVAVLMIGRKQTMEQGDLPQYPNLAWYILEYVALFGIVLLHEFGHALACRSVGGVADKIMLWPLGGVAFVNPPPRPGPVLWSIAAGPLVNVLLLPVTWGLWALMAAGSSADEPSAFTTFLKALAVINTALLVFNLLPVYPLDGGQILQALLWF